jgi:ElaB/YqjD/DUF883 family membrane-anchored ribosome-binding protein
MNAIPTPLQALIELFSSDLAEVRFGDVDASTLTSVAADVESAAEAAASAETRLAEARAMLQERQDLLMQHAQRAMAYARVYAEANASLTARLEAIALPRPARKVRTESGEAFVLSPDAEPPRRPRGRPRKTPLVAPVDAAAPPTMTLDATGE